MYFSSSEEDEAVAGSVPELEEVLSDEWSS